MDSYLIIIESGPKNFSAFSPDVPGCVTVGDTVDETLAYMRDALQGHLQDEEHIPEPKGIEWHFRDDPTLGSDQSLIFAYIPVEQVAPALAHA